MRIAVVSDIHGNRTAFEAVLAHLKLTSPDLIFHGGDLADAGASPAEIVDWVRDLGWPGVVGNTDELLFRPESLQEFAGPRPHLQPVFQVIEEMAVATRAALGEERLAWLRSLPRSQTYGPMALIHASPESLWTAPGPEASDAELEPLLGPLGKPVAIYAHIHRPFVRRLGDTHAAFDRLIANTGSVSLSYDGDRRAAYLLLDISGPNVIPEIQRVEYDVAAEIQTLSRSELPHAGWIANTLENGRPQMP
jgi:predicted phosphodiesterase